jgi:hypothetical protein
LENRQSTGRLHDGSDRIAFDERQWNYSLSGTLLAPRVFRHIKGDQQMPRTKKEGTEPGAVDQWPSTEGLVKGENLADPDRSTVSTAGGNAPGSEDDVERTRRRAFALWERDGRPDGSPDEFWFRAEQELQEPVTAQALAIRTGLNIDEAQDLIDRLGPDWELLEQAAASHRS